MAETDNAPRGVKDLDSALEEFNAGLPQTAKVQQAKKAGAKVAKPKRTTKKQIQMQKGKRKEAVARARMVTGTGEIIVNGVNAKMMKPHEISELIMEPIRISKAARDVISGSNVLIEVYGGGISGQAQAARNALAKALVESSGSESLKRMYLDYDRSMLVDDHRRVEPKKFLGTKARARFQTSYR